MTASRWWRIAPCCSTRVASLQTPSSMVRPRTLALGEFTLYPRTVTQVTTHPPPTYHPPHRPPKPPDVVTLSSSTRNVQLDEDGIAWPADVDVKFKQVEGFVSAQVTKTLTLILTLIFTLTLTLSTQP